MSCLSCKSPILALFGRIDIFRSYIFFIETEFFSSVHDEVSYSEQFRFELVLSWFVNKSLTYMI